MKNLSILLGTSLLIFCAGKAPDTAAHMPSAPTEAAGGNDMFYDLLLKTDAAGPNQKAQESHTRIFLSASGKARVEREGVSVAGHSASGMLLIGDASRPNESILVDDEKKTYTVNHFNPGDLKAFAKTNSTVSKEGSEMILGFNCVRARIISTHNFGAFASTDTLDLWKSSDVPVPAIFGDWMQTFENRSSGMIYGADVPDKLKAIGCLGFTVKMEIHGKHAAVKMELVKAEHRDLGSSLFKVPSGYTEVKHED